MITGKDGFDGKGCEDNSSSDGDSVAAVGSASDSVAMVMSDGDSVAVVMSDSDNVAMVISMMVTMLL